LFDAFGCFLPSRLHRGPGRASAIAERRVIW
jgi:hypothetical protein